MPKQIIVIQGGTTYYTYEQYIDALKTKELTIEKLLTTDWKFSLQVKLGPDYQILLPRMPNSNNAKFQEWEIWFSKLIPLLEDDIALIGHSLGGIFLAKYLSEHKLKTPVNKLMLVAAPSYDDPELVDFQFKDGFESIKSNCKQIYLIYSRDDPVVQFNAHDQYKIKLPDSKSLTFRDRQHFNQSEFPELLELLKNNS